MKNVLGLIFNKLVWVEDRHSFKLVCKEWWRATKKIPKPIVLFRHGNHCLEWKMKMSYKRFHGKIDWDERNHWVFFEHFDFEFYYVKDWLLQFELPLVKYGDEVSNYPIPEIRRVIHPTKGLLDFEKIIDGKTFVYFGIGDIFITHFQKRSDSVSIYTELKNVEPLNDIILYASRELYQKMAHLDEINEREFKKLKV